MSQSSWRERGRSRSARLQRVPHLLSLLSTAALACAPPLPTPGDRPGRDVESDSSGLLVETDPPAPVDAAPPILRVRLSFDGADSADPARVLLFEGEIGPAHLRQIERGTLSKALTERVVPSIAWIEGDLEGSSALVVAPTVPLSLGATYAIACGEPLFAEHLRVAQEDSAAHLDRVWPPLEASATRGFGVWCGPDALPPIVLETRLDPFGPIGMIQNGAVSGIGARCVRFEAGPPSEHALPADALLVPPPSLPFAGGSARLDPRPFTLEAEPAPVDVLACAPEEAQFGPGCVRIEDDRLFGRSPEAPVLWAVAGAGLDHVFTTAAGEPFLLSSLPPNTSITLDVIVIDTQGSALHHVVTSTTLPPMAHIILNEVLANPLGPEPQQEWVELFNDGAVSAQLAGYVLEDIGGEILLPSVELAPGGYALVVNETFVEDGELDPAPAPGTLLLRVPKLGKDGLSNSGEPLKLRDSSGRVVSRFPAGLKVKPGASAARVAPDSPDGLLEGFRAADPSPGGRNGP
jgi:hypothetical protein